MTLADSGAQIVPPSLRKSVFSLPDELMSPLSKGALGRGRLLPEDTLQKNPRVLYAKVSTGINSFTEFTALAEAEENIL
ncbi:hypothetical protein VULLAG_LOCUS8852 [Vulpes lagopus]